MKVDNDAILFDSRSHSRKVEKAEGSIVKQTITAKKNLHEERYTSLRHGNSKEDGEDAGVLTPPLEDNIPGANGKSDTDDMKHKA